jgi:hypothetical protein
MKMIFSNVHVKPRVGVLQMPVVQNSLNVSGNTINQNNDEYRYSMQMNMIGRLMNSRTCKSCQK